MNRGSAGFRLAQDYHDIDWNYWKHTMSQRERDHWTNLAKEWGIQDEKKVKLKFKHSGRKLRKTPKRRSGRKKADQIFTDKELVLLLNLLEKGKKSRKSRRSKRNKKRSARQKSRR